MWTPVIFALVVVLAIVAVLGFRAQRLLLGGGLQNAPLGRFAGLPVSELVTPVRTLATLLRAHDELRAHRLKAWADDAIRLDVDRGTRHTSSAIGVQSWSLPSARDDVADVDVMGPAQVSRRRRDVTAAATRVVA